MEIKQLCKETYLNAFKHGFWDDVDAINLTTFSDKERTIYMNNAITTRLMLIVCEVSEAAEGLRNDDDSNFKEELADVLIRVFDLCEGLGIDIESEITKKMRINKKRPYKHGKSF
jgi:NTP pyrophosphatase (non-canonical NTP hydrolase)